MNPYLWIMILGIPSLISSLLSLLISKYSKQKRDTKTIKSGIQALLRAQMISDYNRWSEIGYAPLYAKENFDNCYKQYHNLGANGVIDKLYKDFMNLPLKSKKKKK